MSRDEVHEPVDEALAEYLQRIDEGQPIDREEFLARHPQVAEELRAYFADLDAMHDMVRLP